MEVKDIITTVGALVGMLLGIYNFMRARSAERVKLQVIPKSSAWIGNDASGRQLYRHNRDRYDLHNASAPAETLSLEIINMSKFPVTVAEVGLARSWSRRRIAIATPIVPDGKPFPRKLEPREHVLVQFDVTRLLELEAFGEVTRAYASTVCGSTCYGSSGALRELVRIASGAA